ncbi:MAG: virulence RhuM family protein [Kiritimatiellae bacterium]|nr:virulence RhuM family protein [Kiritimatiellia bacterium]
MFVLSKEELCELVTNCDRFKNLKHSTVYPKAFTEQGVAINHEEKKNKIVIYQPDETIRIEVVLQNEIVWLNQIKLSALFDVDRSVINRHIRNIYNSGELHESATCVKIAQVQNEGARIVSRVIPFFNLDVIIAVGYRVNSARATQFRIWATSVLREHLLCGYSYNIHLKHLENKMDEKFAAHDKDISYLKEKVDFFI